MSPLSGNHHRTILSISRLLLAVNLFRAFRRLLVPMHYCLKCKMRLSFPRVSYLDIAGMPRPTFVLKSKVRYNSPTFCSFTIETLLPIHLLRVCGCQPRSKEVINWQRPALQLVGGTRTRLADSFNSSSSLLFLCSHPSVTNKD